MLPLVIKNLPLPSCLHQAQPGMINKRTLKEQTALLLAVGRGHARCVECLLDRGADPDIPNKEKETPLFKGIGIQMPYCDPCLLVFVKIRTVDLLKHTWNIFYINVVTVYLYLLIKCCVFLFTFAINALALSLSPACEKENPEMVAILLNKGAMVNKLCIQGWTALHETVCLNNLEIAEMLLKAGAKVNIVNIYGITPLFVAAQSGHLDSLRFLLKNGTIPSGIEQIFAWWDSTC